MAVWLTFSQEMFSDGRLFSLKHKENILTYFDGNPFSGGLKNENRRRQTYPSSVTGERMRVTPENIMEKEEALDGSLFAANGADSPMTITEEEEVVDGGLFVIANMSVTDVMEMEESQ